MKLKIKKLHEDAVIPSYAKDGDACFDLTCVSMEERNEFIQYNTGLAFEIPDGYVGLIYPRSSVTKKDLMLKNSVGIIDSGYRGEVSFRFNVANRSIVEELSEEQINDYLDNEGIIDKKERQFYIDRGMKLQKANMYEVGERVGQMMILPIPRVDFEEVDELSDTDRGDGGYGSTGA